MDNPILENVCFGENIENFPNNSDIEYPIHQCEPLPKKYLDKLPDYIKLFCLPVVNPENKIQLNIDLTSDFIEAFRIYYNLKQEPPQDRIMAVIESELNMALKGFF
jgi:hypothetical protein